MAKNNLISGSIWDEYSKKVVSRMNNPKNQGEITEERANELNGKLIVADFGAESCGDAVRLYWVVNEKTDEIIESKFKSFGCGTAIASSDIMAELCIGKTIDEAVKITNIDVEFALRDTSDIPAVPPQKMHCSVMAYDVIKKAVSLYKGIDIESLETEQIICECARVSLGTLQEVIKINNLTTIEEITKYTKAGAFCKSCIKPGGHEKKDIYLIDVLKTTLEEIEKHKLLNIDKNVFNNNNLVQKIKMIDKILEEEIRPMLLMDGGDLELLDVKEENGKNIVYIKYLGACGSCSSGSTGTLYAIENVLQENLDKNIEVISI